jgi:ABC-type nickel/cobalt efflux system permease component RcnA
MIVSLETIGLILLIVLGVSIVWNVLRRMTAQAAVKKAQNMRLFDDSGQRITYELFEGSLLNSSGAQYAALSLSSQGRVELIARGLGKLLGVDELGREHRLPQYLCTVEELRSEIADGAESDMVTVHLADGATLSFPDAEVSEQLRRL